ncbi:nucleotidyltransferase [Flavobacterium sp.]|uniref:nucleotidyltransferase n=1 Tax=Flavobacterium sp. TaxID=239 RepID=UPI003B9D2F7D
MRISANIITNEKLEVVFRMIDFFQDRKIPYQITGGLAGNLYGSAWKLHDIDLETHLEYLPEIEEAFYDHIALPTKIYQDEEFSIWLLQLNFNGVTVDINAVEDFYIADSIKIETNLDEAREMTFFGRKVKVQPLKDLIAYKKILKREVDVRDLSKLV